LPINYGKGIGTRMDAERSAEKLQEKIEVIILKEE
jgi:hypothetical protein